MAFNILFGVIVAVLAGFAVLVILSMTTRFGWSTPRNPEQRTDYLLQAVRSVAQASGPDLVKVLRVVLTDSDKLIAFSEAMNVYFEMKHINIKVTPQQANLAIGEFLTPKAGFLGASMLPSPHQ